MDVLERQLNSNNPIIVSQIIATLLKNIKQKHESGTDTSKIQELVFLKQICLNCDPLISEVACSGLINLIKEKIVELNIFLIDIVTLIPSAKCIPSVIKLTENVLFLELQEKLSIKSKYICNYNLYSPKHPYILILKEEHCSSDIFPEIVYFFTKRDEGAVYFGYELLKPLFLYAICNPSGSNLNLFKRNLWDFLLNFKKPQSIDLIPHITSWINVQNKENLLLSSELVRNLINIRCSTDIEIFILLETTILLGLIKHKLNAQSTIECLQTICDCNNELISVNCMIVILAKAIPLCSPLYLLELLKLCQLLTNQKNTELWALHILMASLLQWIGNPNYLISEALKVAKTIVFCINHRKKEEAETKNTIDQFFKMHQNNLTPNSEAFWAVQLCLLTKSLNNSEKLGQWLTILQQKPVGIIRKFLQFLYGIFLSRDHDSAIILKAFSLIKVCFEAFKELTTEVLTLILYKLSNSLDSQQIYTFLRTLPKMAVLSDSLMKVVVTIQALSNGSQEIGDFSLILMYETWRVNNKCYSYLEKLLLRDPPQSYNKLETCVTKSFVLRKLCEERPELYGKELVGHLSTILNECKLLSDPSPCTLALEGIIFLCRAGIIDVVTTWSSLEPIFRGDNRISILERLCKLLGEVPFLPNIEAYSEEQINRVTKTLWDFVVSAESIEVVHAALDALTSFELDQISSQTPNEFLTEETLFLKRKNANQIFHIPGNTWIKLLENLSKKNANVRSDFLCKMISAEIKSYQKYIYQVKTAREPLKFDYLPLHSVVRGVGEYIRTNILGWKTNKTVYIECLKIFSKEYSKPLPPIDWCFLQELIHEPDFTALCIDIASHQVILSGTARRLIENYVLASSENVTEANILNVCRNLKHLSNSIQPMILQPFFDNCLNYSISQFYANKCQLLEEILVLFQEVLLADSVEDTNKITICNVVSERLYSIEDESSPIFNTLLKCFATIPLHLFSKLDNLKLLKLSTTKRHVIIKCFFVTHSNGAPLNWLNDFWTQEILNSSEEFILLQSIPVFRKYMNKSAECSAWFLDFIAQLQINVAQKMSKKRVKYYLDTVILSIIIFSGFDILESDFEKLDFDKLVLIFPQAFVQLLELDEWTNCKSQALEWVYFMNTDDSVPMLYRKMFCETLHALRHDQEFIKDNKWMKYMSCVEFFE